jgi:hypothetical protein
MWMEEHIGKRINHERVDEALGTGATTVATACPFCRVMVSDGVGDRAEVAGGRDDVDVRDVANVLLDSIDRSTLTLPAKGAAAERAAQAAPKAAPKAETATVPAEPSVKSDLAAPSEESADKPAAAKAVTGLGLAGGAKRPGAKKSAPPAQIAADSDDKAEPAGAKTAASPAKGLGLAAGAKRPGAKKTAPSAQAAAAAPEVKAQPAESTPAAQAPAKGLGIAAGAKRPGAKKTAAAPQAAPTAASAEETKPQPQAEATPKDKPAETPEEDAGNGDAPPVKGLGIARGARPPGKR